MSRRPRRAVLVGVIVAIVLAVVGAVLLWRTPAPVARPAAPAANDPDAILAGRRAARADGRATDRTPAAASGTVRDAGTRAPIAGAVVLLSPASLLGARDDARGEAAPPLTARTDAAGAWSVPEVAPGRYRLSASAAGYLPAQKLDVRVRAREPQAGLDLALTAGGQSLTGTVTDVGGGAIAGALVSARALTMTTLIGGGDAPAATLTDEAGRYRLDLAPGRYDVAASHADYVAAAKTVGLRGGAATLDFVLTPGGSVQGVVLTRDGRQPVAGAIVRASGGRASMDNLDDLGDVAAFLGAGGVVTDAAGRFVLRGLGSGTLELSALARGHSTREPVAIDLGIGEAREGVEILVETSRTISGYVVRQGQESEGLPGVLVGGIQMKGGIEPTAFDESDETGYFEIMGLQPGKYGLVAARDGLLPNLARKIVDVADADVSDVLLVVETGATLSGRVEPAGVAALSLQVETSTLGFSNILSMVGAALVHGRAGEDGRFELRGVPQGAFTLVARSDAGARGELPVVVRLDDQEGLVVKLEPRGSIAGQVVDGGGAPVAGVEVDVFATERDRDGRLDFGEMLSGDVRSGADGRFEIVGLAPGGYRFSVSENGSGLDWAPAGEGPEPVTLAAGEKKTGVVLRVATRSGWIKGRVVGEGGAPVPDAWVVAREDHGPEGEGGGPDDEAPEASWGRGSAPVLTGPDGRFRIERLRDDQRYGLAAEAAGVRGHRRRVKPGSDVTIKLLPLSGLSGRVTVAGQPVGDYRISVEGPVRQDKHVVAADGAYAFLRLDAGKYDVAVTSEAGSARGTATVSAGETATLDIALEPWGEVSGTIVDALTDKPVSGAYVIAHAQGLGDPGEMATGLLTGGGPRTDAQGRFRVGKIGAGPGSLVVFSGGLLSGMRPILNDSFELRPGEKKDLGTLRALQLPEVPDEQRGWLGFLAAPSEEGPPRLVVATVDEAGPAAGRLLVGDEIVGIDGRPVATLGSTLAFQLLTPGYVKAGQPVRLAVVRAGTRLAEEIVVVAVKRPDGPG